MSERLSIRLNKEEKEKLEKVKKVLGIEDNWGGNSEAIKSCIKLFLEINQKPIHDFMWRYGTKEKKIIKKAIKRGEI